MKRNTKIVIGVVGVLAVAVVVLALLNWGNVASKKEAQEDGVFSLYAGDGEYTVSMSDVEALASSDIKADYKKSGQDPETKSFLGASFKALVESLGIDVSAFSSVSFTAADGYASALDIDEAMDGENCFIVIAMEGEPLGDSEDGGSGPFMMIMAKDQFNQRWCKFLLEVRLQ